MVDRRSKTWVLLTALVACIPEPEYVPPPEADIGHVRHTTDMGMLAAHPDDTISGAIAVSVTKALPPDGPPYYQIEATYRGPNYLRLRHGKSLVIVVDSVELFVASTRYRPSFEQRRPGSQGGGTPVFNRADVVIEGGVYVVSKFDVLALARAETFDLWLIGATKRMRRRAEDEHLERLRAFVVAHVPHHGRPHPPHP